MPSFLSERTTGRRLLRSVAVAAAVASATLLPGTAAVADEPAGTTVVGELVQAYAEAGRPTAEGAPAPVSWVETDGGDAVPVASGDVTGVPAGSTVSLTVGASSGDGGAPVLDAQVLAAPPAHPALAGPLTNQVTVAMVAPAGTPAGPRVARQEIVDLVDGPVARFWADETDGAVALGVTAAHDWLTTTTGCSTPALLWNEVAAKVHFVPGPGKHLLLYIPPTAPGCAYALAEVGSSLTSGGRLYVRDAVPSVIAHEIGHNFGLAHSSGEQCDGALDAGHCRTVGYRDYYDVMGVSWAQTGSLNVLQAAALGVLPNAAIQPVSVFGQAGSITLAPVSGRSGVRGLRLTDASGVDYWLEYRPAEGRDAWLATSANRFALDTGVLLRRTDRFPDTSVLLDGTPSTAAGWDADLQSALTVGTPVTVAGGQFTIQVDAVTAAGAVVSVVPHPPAAAQTAPAPAADPAPGAVLPGESPAGGAPAGDVPAGDAPSTGDAAQAPVLAASPAEPATVAGQAGTPRTSLAAASEPTGDRSTDGFGSIPLVAGLGAALAGASAFVVRRLRRPVRG